jgi:hypothetical protein
VRRTELVVTLRGHFIAYCRYSEAVKPLPSNDKGIFTEPLPSNNRGIFTEPLPSNDKGTFTEPLPSNGRGGYTDTHRQQRDLIGLRLFVQNKESGLKTEKGCEGDG